MKAWANFSLTRALSAAFAPLFFAGAAFAGDESRVILPQYPRPVGERCVEPADVMRVMHMNFILHQRDETVHRGIRGAQHSLRGCIDCHADYDGQGRPIPINAAGQFCESCHAYTAVNIDCFGCHRATPGEVNPMRPSINVGAVREPPARQ